MLKLVQKAGLVTKENAAQAKAELESSNGWKLDM